MDRRRRGILRGGGLIGVTGLAGCTGLFDSEGSDPDSQDNGTTDGTPEQEPPSEDDSSDAAVNTPGAVVCNHHLATEAGLDVLDNGGTAADAAVAVAAALSVVEPWFSSVLGGGTWALYYDAESDEVTSLDGVGPVGSEATPADYEKRGGDPGMHQAIVPGAWDGWMLWLDEYGALELDDVLSPAIEIARSGYPVSPEMAHWLDILSYQIRDRRDAAAIYSPEGQPLEEGDTVYQRGMADTFESLIDAYDDRREEGRSRAIQAARDYFYRGPIAESIVEFSDQDGGYLTLPDFHGFEAQIVDPLSIDYDDALRVYQNPPNSQGITMLLALNILKEYDMSAYGPDDADAVHLQTEAIKLAFAERYYHVGDPDRVDVPVADLLDEEYADRQGDRIDMDRAMEWPIDSGLDGSSAPDVEADHTTTFHVVDDDGNAAAVTTSLGAQFLVVGDTGIHINNRMRMISTEDGNPNRLTPGYKVRHTSNPYMAFRNGRPYILGGNTGVDTQPQGQVQQFLHVAEFGLSAQETVDRPRFVSTAFPSGTFPHDVGNTLQMESGFPDPLIAELRERGHDVEVGTGIFGTANMILVEEGGESLQIGAEPRTSTAEGDVLSSE